MTRINVVPTYELSDQWLLAEYHELPRCIKQKIDIREAPSYYKLGPGHMKWAKAHSLWLIYRYSHIIDEMKWRGFNPTYGVEELQKFWNEVDHRSGNNWYEIRFSDILINRDRLLTKYLQKPSYYKWTNRPKPNYLENIQ